jgi:putative DNA primase/helicase
MTTSPSDISAQVAARVAAEAEYLPKANEPQPQEIDNDFIADCLDKNELGDGRLFANMFRGKFIHVKKWDKRPWLKFDRHWTKDKLGEVMTAVEQVAQQYAAYAETFTVPIKREKDLLSEANARLATAEKRIGNLRKQSTPDTETISTIDRQIREAEADVLRHQTELDKLERQRKAALHRATKLRSVRGAQNCLTWAHHVEQPLAITGEELDRQPWLLACPNTVVDLRTGTWRNGRPEDYLLRTVSVDFPLHLGQQAIEHYLIHGVLPDGSSPHPSWTAFKTSVQPDGDILACMDRIMGYAITGHSRLEQFIAVYLGPGRNGKGTYFDTIQDIMGDLAWTVKPELILEDKNARSSGSASPEIIMLEGRRVVIASENDANRRISGAKVKSLTGGDRQNARGLFSGDEENIDPTWTLFLHTNDIPGGLTRDFALRQRLILIDFPYMFVDDPAEEGLKEPHNSHRFKPKDKGLFARLQQEKPYILMDLIRCCLLWQQAGGINPPDKMKAEIEDLRIQEDTLQQYLHDRCLMEWEPLRIYDEGHVCSVSSGQGAVGSRYRSLVPGNKGKQPPDYPDLWRYDGPGLMSDHPVIFSEFYDAFRKWYANEISDSDKYRPSKKAVAKQLRDKGLDVRARGGETRVWGGIEVLPMG